MKSETSEEESKIIREVLSLAKPCHDLRRALRIQAWVRRFTTHRVRKGPLTSDIHETKNWWIDRVQSQDSQKPPFEQTR